MSREDIDLPQYAPEDLIDVIFTPGLKLLVQDAADTKHATDEFNSRLTANDFFCMPCFHKAYTEWKKANGID